MPQRSAILRPVGSCGLCGVDSRCSLHAVQTFRRPATRRSRAFGVELRLGVRRYRTPDAGVDPDVVHAAAPDARRDSNRHVSLETTSVRLNCVLYALPPDAGVDPDVVHRCGCTRRAGGVRSSRRRVESHNEAHLCSEFTAGHGAMRSGWVCVRNVLETPIFSQTYEYRALER